MQWQTIPYLFLLVFSIVIATSLFFITWRNHKEYHGAFSFALLLLSIIWWSCFYLLEIISTTDTAKLFWSNLQYIGIVGVVLMWFVFALVYTGRRHLLKPVVIILLLIEPIALQILLWTNESHHLIRQHITTANSITTTQTFYGPAFWIHALYSYALLFIGTGLLIQPLFRRPKLYRKQVILILIGLSVPWIANFLYLFNMTTNDLTPIGFTVSGLALGWGLLRLQLLGMVPTAYSTVFTSLSDAVLVVNDQNQIVDLNPAAERMIAQRLDDMLGKSIVDLFSSQADLVAQYLDTREAHTELTIAAPDNTAFYVDLRISPLLDWQGQFIGRTVVLRDITQQKKVQISEREQRVLAETLSETAAILNSNLKLDAVFKSILANVERVLPHDAANIMLVENGKAQVVGFNGYNISSDEPKSTVDQLDLDRVATLSIMNRTGKYLLIPDVRNFPGWKPSEHTAWIRGFLGAPIQFGDKVIGFINVDNAQPNMFTDEHGQRLQAFANQAGIALRNAHLFSELEARNQELDAYAHTIAHDLKAPLSLILGYANLLTEFDLPEDARLFVDTIENTSLNMVEMVDQLLLLARLRDMSTTAVDVEVTAVVMRVLARFETKFQERAITIHIDKPLLPAVGHQPWIEEVFANLIGNAIKYIGINNNDPQITILSQQQGTMVRYEIIDNGLGITQEYQANIFDMFSRFHKEEASGTGLGLSIVKRMVRKMKGDLGVISEPGKGSKFWFTLTAVAPPPSSD